ncbi:MAG TPA: hypothetical protein VG406_03100 [Isosphaeraceae bacterium]|nr:hypothetical protein [Isosphaeraceae bacterium]
MDGNDPNEEAIPPALFLLRAAWVAVRILLVIWLGEPGLMFFYQAF